MKLVKIKVIGATRGALENESQLVNNNGNRKLVRRRRRRTAKESTTKEASRGPKKNMKLVWLIHGQE